MFAELKEMLDVLEENLALLQSTPNPKNQAFQWRELKGNLHYVKDFVEKNIVETKEGDLVIQAKLAKEYAEGTRYLGQKFIDSFFIFTQELQKQRPDVERLLSSGTDLLQRLKSFSKVSSPSTF